MIRYFQSRKRSGLNTKLATLATKLKLGAQQNNIVKLRKYFLNKIYFDDDGSQKMFIYQLRLNALETIKHKGIKVGISYF